VGLKLAKARGHLNAMPDLPSVPVGDNAEQGFFTDEEVALVVSHLPGALKPLVQFLALTGWRSREASQLAWAEVNRAEGKILLRASRSKNGRAREFPCPPGGELAALLKGAPTRTAGSCCSARSSPRCSTETVGRGGAPFYRP